MLNVLVACEESQRVCTAFRELGHNAFSCDLQECGGGHPEWHIQGDCVPLLAGGVEFTTMDGVKHRTDSSWDLIVAHPPCTYTTNAGARHLYRGHKLNMPRLYQGFCGKALFSTIYNAEAKYIVIENPVPSKIFGFPDYSQIIQPYMFGDSATKKTCLWLKNLPNLEPTNMVEPYQSREIILRDGTRRRSCWEMDVGKSFGGEERQIERSRTFPGIAKAIAEQYSKYIEENCNE